MDLKTKPEHNMTIQWSQYNTRAKTVSTGYLNLQSWVHIGLIFWDG